MKLSIVTTTINSPTEALHRFILLAHLNDWDLIIVGDQKTPHDDYNQLEKEYSNVLYLDPDTQVKMSSTLSDLIGWNSIQRRNFGFIQAWKMGADIIATVDDDNIPYDNWGQNLAIGSRARIALYQCLDIVFDPLSATRYRDLWHRGFPVELLPQKNRSKYLAHVRRARTLVQADLWDGEPDVDAVARIALGPFDVKFDEEPFAATRPGPFNSQNTFLARACFPDYFLFPGIGRMDDIWASYVLQRLFPHTVVYGGASVYQERNEHSLVADLEQEMIGHSKTLALVADLYTAKTEKGEFQGVWEVLEKYLPAKATRAWAAYRECFKDAA